MKFKKVIIVKKYDISDFNSFTDHKLIVRFIEAPYDYVLFEYYDNAFELIYHDDNNIRYDKSTINEANRIHYELSEILKPLYRQENKETNTFVHSLNIFINDIEFKALSIKKRKHIPPDHFKDHLPLSGIIFKVYFKVVTHKHISAFEAVLNDWMNWGISNKYINKISSINHSNDNSCTVVIDFFSDVADCMIILLRMLDDTITKHNIHKFSID